MYLLYTDNDLDCGSAEITNATKTSKDQKSTQLIMARQPYKNFCLFFFSFFLLLFLLISNKTQIQQDEVKNEFIEKFLL